MQGTLFLPNNSTPPYQTIVYFYGTGALASTTEDDFPPDSVLERGPSFLWDVRESLIQQFTMSSCQVVLGNGVEGVLTRGVERGGYVVR